MKKNKPTTPRRKGRKYQKKYKNRKEANQGMRKLEKDKFPQPKEVKALLKAARAESSRDYMLLFCTANLGLRATEAVSLSRKNFEELEETDFAYIRTAKVRVEKDPWDAVPVDEETKVVLQKYIEDMPKAQVYLFPGQGKRKFITERTANNIFNLHAATAGMRKVLTFHSLRHFLGTKMYEYSDGNIRYVQAVMRHRSVNSTWIYAHVTKETLLGLVKKKEKFE